MPTIGMNCRHRGIHGGGAELILRIIVAVAVVQVEGISIKFWDLGGSEKLHSIWRNYYADSDGIVFVVDGLDWERMEGVRDSFATVTSHDSLEGVPVLVVVNKLDLRGEEKEDVVARVKEVFNPIMPTIGARESRVVGCSALKGYACNAVAYAQGT